MKRFVLRTICPLVLLAGCGGSPTPVAQPDNTIRVRLNDFRIEPRDVSVRPGRVRLRAVNDGHVTHNLTIMQADPKRGRESIQYGRTPTLHPGQKGEELAAIVLKPGRYRLVSTVGNNADLGQYGTLIVKP